MPHVHILLLRLGNENIITSVVEIDSIVFVELPNKEFDPIAHASVSSFMMHGKWKVQKVLSLTISDYTIIRFPQYQRMNTSITTLQNGVELDNCLVVPYNVNLTIHYQAHINVEICNRTRAIIYLFKYINKGLDSARVVFKASTSSSRMDKIQNYLNCHYLSTHESCRRFF